MLCCKIAGVKNGDQWGGGGDSFQTAMTRMTGVMNSEGVRPNKRQREPPILASKMMKITPWSNDDNHDDLDN